MQRALLILLLMLLATIGGAIAAQPTNRAQTALNSRAQERQNDANAEQAAHYAANRQRCQAALRIAKLCGKFAGRFSCDEKGFKEPEATARKPPALDAASTYRMERCAADAAGKSP
jgi:hypothetical protein